MNKIQSIFAAIALMALLLPAIPAAAQFTESGYFTDGYLYRHEMNPAIGNDQGYVAMPGVSNVNVTYQGNIGVNNILFNRNGRTTTFLNPEVTNSEFLSGIKDKNKLLADVKLQVLGFGFKGFKGYSHVGINVRTNVGAMIPGSLLRLAKEGVENKEYDISDLRAQANAYVEVALGHSHKINDHLDIGATAKVLVGAGHGDAKCDKALLSLQDDEWHAVTNATLQTSIKGLTYKEETKQRGPEGDQHTHTYMNGMDIDKTGVNGIGAALDLGAVYRINDNWTVSASVLDLGFISWFNNMVASTNGDREFTTDTYLFVIDNEADNRFEREMDRLGEGVAALYELNNNGDKGGRTTNLAPTVNVGLEYTVPGYKQLSFGLLGTTRIGGVFSYTDCRLSTNWKVKKLLSLGVNVSAGTFGVGYGWIFNFHPNGFNLYLATDHMFSKLSKQGVPLTSNAHVNLGINFPF